MKHSTPSKTKDDEFKELLTKRYHSYLSTSFYFRDKALRKSFAEALNADHESDHLIKGPIYEGPRSFKTGCNMQDILRETFSDEHEDALHAFRTEGPLYLHQEQAISKVANGQNVVVASGTASGKTECFLYPILMELYRQHLCNALESPGVRAMILYPMNALANDQCDRLRKICRGLSKAGSKFKPTFGKYIGETPEDDKDLDPPKDHVPNEILTREQMRDNPPHILLTNYSMLEYLLIRPKDCALFDDGRGTRWRFIVLDEAHEYRGTKGVEIGMLMRRLRHRLRRGGNRRLNCIAASATLAAGTGEPAQRAVAEFASELFGDKFAKDNIIFGEQHKEQSSAAPVRRHYFMRGLEGAYLVYDGETDIVQLNNRADVGNPIEIALCRECGQHYYVGQSRKGYLEEADRDQSSEAFGVEYYLPVDTNTIDVSDCEEKELFYLDRVTRALLVKEGSEGHDKDKVLVMLCKNNVNQPDWIQECVVCRHHTQVDPVHEVVYGNDEPNTIVATVLHQQGRATNSRVLSFSDSRQGAAYFAVHVDRSYKKMVNRHLLHRTISKVNKRLSIDDMARRLLVTLEKEEEFFKPEDSDDFKNRVSLKIVLEEALTRERSKSLAGVGLVKWSIELPKAFPTPDCLLDSPWNLKKETARSLVASMLDWMRRDQAIEIISDQLTWASIDVMGSPISVVGTKSEGKKSPSVRTWFYQQNSAKAGYLRALLIKLNPGIDSDTVAKASSELMNTIWTSLIKEYENDPEVAMLSKIAATRSYRIKDKWIRCESVPEDGQGLYKCDRCANYYGKTVGDICQRYRCYGSLHEVSPDDVSELELNYYRTMYAERLPLGFKAEEHTAQLEQENAKEVQQQFKNGEIDMLSSSTTFEMGVDLGDLNTVFLRNVPPEPFNYIQRSGRAGRRDSTGTVITYCGQSDHDRYHYIDPENSIMKSPTKFVPLHVNNPHIIIRHAAAILFSSFFRSNSARFGKMTDLYSEGLSKNVLTKLLRKHAAGNDVLKRTMMEIIPESVWTDLGFETDQWIENLVGADSTLGEAEKALCAEYRNLTELNSRARRTKNETDEKHFQRRMRTMQKEAAISFLSRKAIIPKYGFPVDVVELDLSQCEHRDSRYVRFSRDLSQAIVEYAPGSALVAKKKIWRSYGLKIFKDTAMKERYYKYDKERNFTSLMTETQSDGQFRKYLIPEFGFQIERGYTPKLAKRRPQRQHSTRPYFLRFCDEPTDIDKKTHFGMLVTKALPAEMVVLCEGKRKAGFDVCMKCGYMKLPSTVDNNHKTGRGQECDGNFKRYALGHQFVTSVVQLQRLSGSWTSDNNGVYALAYALMYGVSATLEVPYQDLNVTVTGGELPNTLAVALYDNVPGGAGLVDNLFDSEMLKSVIQNAKERVEGACGCDENSSCYGCLRSWRNQFVHKDLKRSDAKQLLEELPL